MKKLLLASLLLPILGHAAVVEPVWGPLPKQRTGLADGTQLSVLAKQKSHTRYQVMYQGLPVWGYQLIKHDDSKIRYTGHRVRDIAADLPTTHAKLSKQAVLSQLSDEQPKHLTSQKIIYLKNNMAHLAYKISYFSQHKSQLSHPTVIIDANDGQVLKRFDSLSKLRVGQGPGGNSVQLPHREGVFQYGEVKPGIHSLGKFDVTLSQGQCIVANDNFEVVNMQNRNFSDDLVPVTVDRQVYYPTFSYPCSRQSGYINQDDGGYSPANEGYSPINDTMFFAQATLDMYRQVYGDDKPFGDDLPMRAYVHLANFDNAFALSPEYEDGKLVYHQQIVIGNGEYDYTPMTQMTISHELSHNVTAHYSNLIYDGQSGGINEAFSDMVVQALYEYLSRLYPWYWDGKDWTFGREESLVAEPLRYMEQPSKDGHSIDHASQYYEGMNVHSSSGVFNRAYYLLAHQAGWNAQKAFQVMFDANRYYWVPNTNFDFAACGVIQATSDLGWNTQAVKDSFKEVGVTCPLS